MPCSGLHTNWFVCTHCSRCFVLVRSAKALSKYTEMVDNLIRQQKDKLEAASDEARLRLREWDMPEALQALDAGSAAALPDGLRAELEQLEDHGGVRHLHDLAAQIKV